MNELTLKAKQVGVQVGVHPAILDQATIDVEEQFLGQLMYRLKTYVMTDQLDDHQQTVSVEVHVPISWWDHFKDEHPRLTRFFKPARFRTHGRTEEVRWERGLSFPESTIYPKALGDPLKYIIRVPGKEGDYVYDR